MFLSVKNVGGYEETAIVATEVSHLVPETSDVTIVVLKSGQAVRADEGIESVKTKLRLALTPS